MERLIKACREHYECDQYPGGVFSREATSEKMPPLRLLSPRSALVLLLQGIERHEARALVSSAVERKLGAWSA